MLVNTLKKKTAVLMVIGATAVLFIGRSLAADPPLADKDLAAAVDKRVQEWQPTAEEKRFDEIGWCRSIVDAERLARQHKRPIFWFTHDGRMNVGRC